MPSPGSIRAQRPRRHGPIRPCVLGLHGAAAYGQPHVRRRRCARTPARRCVVAPGTTAHVYVGAGDGPCAILMIGLRPETETLHYPVSEVAARYGASVASETCDRDEPSADWPGEYHPVPLPWPP